MKIKLKKFFQAFRTIWMTGIKECNNILLLDSFFEREIEDIETNKIDDNTLNIENVKIELKNETTENQSIETKVNVTWNLEVILFLY